KNQYICSKRSRRKKYCGKSKKAPVLSGFAGSRDMWKRRGGFPRKKSDRGFPQKSFSFSTGKVEKSALGIDVRFDLFHRLGKGCVFLHLLLNLLDGIENRGVVPVVKKLADLIQAEVRHGSDQVHGNLPGGYGVPDPLLSPDDGFLQTVELADVIQ